MKIFPNIFRRGVSADDLKQLFDEVQEQNQFYRALLENVTAGSTLGKDRSQKAYIKAGYEQNADVFSIISKIATMMSEVPLKVVDKDDQEVDNPLAEIIRQPNNYQIWKEFIRLYETFFLSTGNGIIYAPRLTGGNDKGKLMQGMFMMPTQNVDIIANSWRDPIAFYTLDISSAQEKIPADQVLHIRMPNLQYDEGRQFMGMSPIKVAAAVIEAQNQGLNIMATTLQKGIAPGVLTREDIENTSPEKASEFERSYRSKYGNQSKTGRAGLPVLTGGKWNWVQMGFSNFRDLQIIETSQHGLRVLANVWGMPSDVFNDSAGSTFNNQTEARKAVYTNRIMPDYSMLLDTLNIQIAPGYGEVKIIADYSAIPELQADKAKLAEWLDRGVANGSLTRNQWLEIMGLELSDKPGMDVNMVPFNMVPIDQIGLDVDPEKILKDHGIDDYKGLKAV